MTEKQSQARNLFFQTDLTRTQIADIVKVPRRTLHYWIREKNWDRQKQAATHMPALLAENIYHIIGRFTQQLMGEDRIMRPITHKEADTLHKLTLTVNKMKNRSTLNESMEMFGLFMECVNKKSPDFAQQLMPYVDDYIASRADVNIAQFRPDYFNEMGLIPQTKEDPAEAQLDMQDIMAWTEGEGLIPEAAEQVEQKAKNPEPLPKQTIPARKAAFHRSVTPASKPTNQTTAQNTTAPAEAGQDLVAEMNSLIAEFSPETREELLKFAEANMPIASKDPRHSQAA